MLRILKLALVAAVVVTLFFALDPKPPQLLHSDKSQHELAFATLTLLSALAFPAANWRTILLALGCLGGMIEILQMIPVLHRDSELLDWVADLAAIVVTLVLVALARRAVAAASRG